MKHAESRKLAAANDFIPIFVLESEEIKQLATLKKKMMGWVGVVLFLIPPYLKKWLNLLGFMIAI